MHCFNTLWLPTSVSCCIWSSTGDGDASSTGFPSGVTGVGLTCFLRSLISFWIVLTRRHCHPKYPAHSVYKKKEPITMGCMRANDLPSNIPNSPPTASASCANNTTPIITITNQIKQWDELDNRFMLACLGF